MEEKKFIPGIYNYCDRWCEHCSFRDRCFLYNKEKARMEEHIQKGEEPFDMEIVLKDVKESFTETRELISKYAQEQGIELDSLPEVEYKTVDVERHPLYKLAHKYMDVTHKFLKELRKILEAEGISLADRIEIVASPEESIDKLKQLASWYEIIAWYHTLIPAKVYRALAKEITDDEEVRKFEQEDAEKSVRVAYIGLMKSMKAFDGILKWNENLEDSLLPILITAERLRKAIDKQFPEHHKRTVITRDE
jgi:hypothetical protein